MGLVLVGCWFSCFGVVGCATTVWVPAGWGLVCGRLYCLLPTDFWVSVMVICLVWFVLIRVAGVVVRLVLGWVWAGCWVVWVWWFVL